MRASIIITNVILISLSSCYASQKVSLQSIDKLVTLVAQHPENHLTLKVWGRLDYYTIGDGSVNKISRNHRVSSCYISQDTLRMILSPRGNSQEVTTMNYNIPVSMVESVTFRKFVVLFPLVFFGVPLITLLILNSYVGS